MKQKATKKDDRYLYYINKRTIVMMNKLFYLKFETRNNEYLYDGITGTVIPENGYLEKAVLLLSRNDANLVFRFDDLGRDIKSQMANSAIIFAQRWNRNLGGFINNTDESE